MVSKNSQDQEYAFTECTISSPKQSSQSADCSDFSESPAKHELRQRIAELVGELLAYELTRTSGSGKP
jgi:hypothetical protein